MKMIAQILYMLLVTCRHTSDLSVKVARNDNKTYLCDNLKLTILLLSFSCPIKGSTYLPHLLSIIILIYFI